MSFVDFVPPKAAIPEVTAETVALANRMDDYTVALRAAQQERVAMEKAEELHRDEYVKSLYAQDAMVELAGKNVSKAGQAMNIIKMNVPDALHTAVSQAGAAVRAHDVEMEQLRRSFTAANNLLHQRRTETLSTDEEAAYMKEVHVARVAIDRAADHHLSLIEVEQRAKKLVDAKIQEIIASCE